VDINKGQRSNFGSWFQFFKASGKDSTPVRVQRELATSTCEMQPLAAVGS